ncbi:hypothetical protein EV421DRAFT_1742084 [Armillaria borealis]|uniref:Uncharacterized protein n=1 Tax=Armillaria borealis TaxID=47425 RepID=A0AA39IZH0_9AGAR|nr:hypothetical protein EV421DRAFT_1747061 [Armillaria borealis]KAK0432690.1 hypothetical protein EV421DRAFT_1742084 [Armillaria borealis]
MDLVRIVAGLFKVSESAVQQEIDQMKSILGTDKAALTDLKKSSNKGRAASFFSQYFHYQTEHLSDIDGNQFNVALPSLYHAMDTLVKLKSSDTKPYLTVLDAQVVHGRARQSSYHVANCFDLRCARRPICRDTLAKGPVPCLVLNAPASTEFYQEGIGSLQSFVAMLQKREEMGTTESKEYQAWATTLMKVAGTFKTWSVVGILHRALYPTLYTSSPKDEILSCRTIKNSENQVGLVGEEYAPRDV